MMRPRSWPIRGSLYTCLKIHIAEKTGTAGSGERQIPLRKLFSLSLFPSMSNLCGGWAAFHLLIRTGLHFMDLVMEVKLLCAFRLCWKATAFPFVREISETGPAR